MSHFTRFIADEDAPTFFEYGLLIVVIALLVLTAATLLGISVSDMFDSVPTD